MAFSLVRLLSVRGHLGISKETVYRWLDKKRIPSQLASFGSFEHPRLMRGPSKVVQRWNQKGVRMHRTEMRGANKSEALECQLRKNFVALVQERQQR